MNRAECDAKGQSTKRDDLSTRLLPQLTQHSRVRSGIPRNELGVFRARAAFRSRVSTDVFDKPDVIPLGSVEGRGRPFGTTVQGQNGLSLPTVRRRVRLIRVDGGVEPGVDKQWVPIAQIGDRLLRS